MIRLVVLACLLALAGCAMLPPGAPSPTSTSPARVDRYDAEPGRDAAMLARLRAAPAPAAPAVADGSDPRGDRNQLATQGFARIGTGYFPRDAAGARAAALRKGQEVGADRVLLYPPGAAAADAGGEWVAAYYVKLRLAFGATFRNLRSEERERLGLAGVVIGKVLPNTPASLANIRPGDIVLALDGEPATDRASFQRLLERAIGRRAVLTLVRNGERLQRTVRLGGGPAR
jgi:hypothetical protein